MDASKLQEQLRDDGRNIDPQLGTLRGEGSLQRVETVTAPLMPHDDGTGLEEREDVEAEGPSYYGAPLLKEPVWKWYIPTYFYAGGVAGAAAALGGAAQLAIGGGGPGLLRRRMLRGEHRLVR